MGRKPMNRLRDETGIIPQRRSKRVPDGMASEKSLQRRQTFPRSKRSSKQVALDLIGDIRAKLDELEMRVAIQLREGGRRR